MMIIIANIFKLVLSIIAAALVLTIFLFFFFYWLINYIIKVAKKKKAITLAEFSKHPEKHKIVFLGDSLTDFYPLEEFFHGVDIYNRGIAGDTTDDVLNRLENTVFPLEPRTLFLQIGTNDYLDRKSNQYIFENIKKIIYSIKNYVPNVKIYLISLYPVNPKVFFTSLIFVGPRKNKEIVELNSMLVKYCDETGIKYINVHDKLTDKQGYLNKKYTVEGLHINYYGYTVITKILQPFVTIASND